MNSSLPRWVRALGSPQAVAALCLLAGLLLVTWALAEAVGRWWVWPGMIGLALLLYGGVLVFGMVEEARAEMEQKPLDTKERRP